MKEIEVKVLFTGDPREGLRRKGYTMVWKGVVETLYFDRNGELKETGRALRLRFERGDGVVAKVGYKRTLSERGVSIYEEYATEVKDGEEMKSILLGLGYRVVVRVEKEREMWAKDGITVTLERLLSHPCVPPYAEVEVVEERAEALPRVVEELFPGGRRLALNTIALIGRYCHGVSPQGR